MIATETLVAISVSAPDEADMASRGLSSLHVRYMFTELVRFVLAEGGSVAYGGRLDDPGERQPNFTRIMLDLVAGYRPDQRPADDRLVNFVASVHWRDAHGGLQPAYRELHRAYQGRIQMSRCGPGPDDESVPDRSAVSHAASLAQMREQMAERCHTRIVLGGRLAGYSGRYPGIVEEAIATARRSKPLYIVGGWGGCASALARRMLDEPPDEPDRQLTQAWQHAHTPSTLALAEALAGSPLRIALDSELDEVLPAGRWAAVHNGLTDQDNDRLAVSSDPDEVVALVVRGLRTCFPRPGA